MDREVGEMLREELWQFYRTHSDAIWQAEISRIGGKMQITSGNINTVMYDL